MPIVLDFGTVGNIESQTAEYGSNFLTDKRERMACTHWRRCRRARQVEGGCSRSCRSRFCCVAQTIDTLGGIILQFVYGLAYLAFLLSGHIAEINH